MGYLSQRKKSERESFFLKISSIIFVLLTIISFMPIRCATFPDILFHFYFLNFVLFIYSFFVGRLLYVGIFLVLFIINFFHISAYANIFFNNKVDSIYELPINYTSEEQNDLSATDVSILRSGYIELSSKEQTKFWLVEKNNHVFNIIRINFSKLSSSERKRAFRLLTSYVATQDNPLIIYGYFGEAAWSDNMRAFLKKTGLKVKNHLIFAEKGARFNPFVLPKFYVLGFSNLGVKQIDIIAPQNKEYPNISMLLGFN